MDSTDKTCKPCRIKEEVKGIFISLAIGLLICFYFLIIIRKRVKFPKNCGHVPMNILSDYMQIFGMFYSVSNNFIEEIGTNFNVNSVLLNPNYLLTGIECSFNIFFTDINIYFKKLILFSLIILFTPLILFLVGYILKCLINITNHAFSYIWITSFLVIFKNLQATFIHFIFSAFQCTYIEDNYYLTAYPQEPCWSPMHIKIVIFLFVPSLLIWMILIPGFISFKIFKKKRSGSTLDTLAYFTLGYKEEYYYWDFVLMINKFFLIFIITFIYDSMLIMDLFFLNSLLMIFLQVFCKPFKYAIFNTLTLMSRISAHLFLICSIGIANKGISLSFAMFLSYLMFLTNIAYFAYWIRLYIKLNPNLMKLWNRVFDIWKLETINIEKIYAENSGRKIRINFHKNKDSPLT